MAGASLADLDEGDGQPPPSFTGWLYRPYLDLAPAPRYGNPQTEGLLLALRSFLNEDDQVPRIHALFTPSTRVAIVNQARMPQYHANDPRDLAPPLRTVEWEALNSAFVKYGKLSAAQQARTLWLLHRLHMHRAILTLGPRSKHSPDIRYLLALAGLALALDGHRPRDLNALKVVALNTPGTWAAVEATYHLAAISGKLDKDATQTWMWVDEHEQAIHRFAPRDEHTEAKLWSRYYRVAAFVPMLKGDYDRMVYTMDLAEKEAAKMETDTPEQTVEYQAVHSALYESRAKEAMLLKDLSLAEKRARAYIELSPRFPMAHLCLGEVFGRGEMWAEAANSFRSAALYGPPETARAWFYRGNCLEEVGELEQARDAYLSAIDADPGGIASYELLRGVARELGAGDLAQWAASALPTT